MRISRVTREIAEKVVLSSGFVCGSWWATDVEEERIGFARVVPPGVQNQENSSMKLRYDGFAVGDLSCQCRSDGCCWPGSH